MDFINLINLRKQVWMSQHKYRTVIQIKTNNKIPDEVHAKNNKKLVKTNLRDSGSLFEFFVRSV